MDSKILASGYGISPRSVWTNPLLTFNEKAFLVYLLSFTGASKMEAWPSVATIGEELGVSHVKVAQVLGSLCDKKVISKGKLAPNNPFNHSNKYFIHLEAFLIPVEPAVPKGRNLSEGTEAERSLIISLPVMNKEISTDISYPTTSRPLIDDSLPSEFLSILSEFHPSLFSTCRLPKAGMVPSKTLSTLRTELGRLRTGTFLHSHQWDNDWMKTNANRFSEHGTTSWEEVGTMVRTSVEHLQEAIKLGMKWTPCSPAQFIVNDKEPGKCRSAFLTFLTQKPKSQAGRIDEAVAISIPEKTKNRIKDWYETLDPSARLPMKWAEKDWQKVWYSVKELKDWFTANTDAMDSANDDGQWGYRLGSFGNFLTAVLDFLSGGGAGQQITPRLLPLEGWKWDAFVKHLLTDYDVKMARVLK